MDRIAYDVLDRKEYICVATKRDQANLLCLQMFHTQVDYANHFIWDHNWLERNEAHEFLAEYQDEKERQRKRKSRAHRYNSGSGHNAYLKHCRIAYDVIDGMEFICIATEANQRCICMFENEREYERHFNDHKENEREEAAKFWNECVAEKERKRQAYAEKKRRQGRNNSGHQQG